MKTYRAFPAPFCYYRAILGSDHLHFGLWPEGEEDSSIQQAQENMLKQLLSFFPPAPANVLDVGCGLGLSASLLRKRGYNVTAIAPSAELIAYASETYGEPGLAFVARSFFDDDPVVFRENAYDVLFFQESMQYLSPLEEAAAKAHRLLKENGVLILGDEVCCDPSITSETAVHPSGVFVTALSEKGFAIKARERVGNLVGQTCDFVIERFEKDFRTILSECPGEGAEETLLKFLEGWKQQKEWYRSGKFGYELIAAKKDRFIIRPYTDGDESRIVPEFRRVFGVERSLEHWFWKFRDNPYGSHRISEAFSGEGNLVTHYAGYPVPFHSDVTPEKDLLSFQIGDTFTTPEVRNIGLGKTGLLARTANHFYEKFCRHQVPFIYGFNTGHIKKLGARYLGYSYIEPIMLRMRNLTSAPLSNPRWSARLFRGYSVERVSKITDEWTSFFERVCTDYRLLVRRDRTYLTWRYQDCPDRAHTMYAVRAWGRLAGWCVVSRRGNTLVLGDTLIDRRLPGAFSFLLAGLGRDTLEKCEKIEGWFSPHPEWWAREMDELGFGTVAEPNGLVPCFVVFRDPSFLETLQNHFYYTMGDSDLF